MMLLLSALLSFKGFVDGLSIRVGYPGDFSGFFDCEPLVMHEAAQFQPLLVRQQNVLLDHDVKSSTVY